MEESSQLKRRRVVRSKKLEFIRWGSKPLIDFLESIGKDTSRQLGQYFVTAIINDYINANNLTNPIKKKEVICDEKLQALFGKKSLPRSRIFHLLDSHFAINQRASYDEGVTISHTAENASLSKCEPSCRKDKVSETNKSSFAAVIQDNIKLVYLRKTLVQNLAEVPELFEEKLIGSFVRIKFDRRRHQLHQVLGVKTTSKIHLQLSNCAHDVSLDDLSDENFSQRECEDLWRRIKDGFLKRPTIVELEVKARMLHEDITRHDIQRDLQWVESRIAEADANEKGWRLVSQRYRNERKVLEDPSEQKKRLSRIPHVLPDESEPQATPSDALVKEKGSISSPILIQSEQEPEATAADAIVRKEGNSSPLIIQSEAEPEATAADAIVKEGENSSSIMIIQKEIPIGDDWCIDFSQYFLSPGQPTSEVPRMDSTEVLTEAASSHVQKRDSTEILTKAAAPEDHKTTKASSSGAKPTPAASTSEGKRARK